MKRTMPGTGVPYSEVTVRDRGRSSDVVPMRGDITALLEGTRPAVVLIHGFANTEDAARGAYARFLNRLERELSPLLGSRADVIAMHWPGNHPHRIIDLPTFSVRIGPANDAGAELAGAIALSRRPRVVLVAHSLGSRVAMSALSRLEFSDDPPQVDAVLLAAAVPVWQCEAGERFHHQPAGTTTTVLHSTRDMVLWLAFPPGQEGSDRFGEAVGRRGRPEGDRWTREAPTALGHSQYWDDAQVAYEVARIVRCSPAPGSGPDRVARSRPRSVGPLPSVPTARVDALPRLATGRRRPPSR